MPKVASRLPKEIQHLIDELYKPSDKVRSRQKLIKPALGHLALFYYPDPKYKATLPVYDVIPLVILLWFDGKYVEGINTHYIPYSYRMQLLKRIMSKLENGKRLKYKDIKDAWEKTRIPMAYARLAYRKYLVNRIRSEFRIFNHTNYYPVAKEVMGEFKKQTATKVMRDINKEIKNKRARG